MAKCPICDLRKGKRNCLIAGNMICSLCCGNTRIADACSNCAFYHKPKRKYEEVPSYSVSDMDGNIYLESYGSSIEGALCAYDIMKGRKLKDEDAIRIIELLIDKYHFQDQQLNQENELVVDGASYVDEAIREDLRDIENKEIVKILGVIRFVAKRRTRIGREYMNVVHQYVGQRIGSGIRILQQ